MERIKYDSNLIKIMSMFESITSAKIKDAVGDNEQLLFIVQENQIGRAVGKHGSNVLRLEKVFKRKIKIVEFSDDVRNFIGNFIYPLRVQEINSEGKKITIIAPDVKTRGQLIGRDAKNIRFLNDIVKRYFDIDEVKVA